MSTFQIVLTAVFGFFILAGLVLFATLKGTGNQGLPTIQIWGTVSARDFSRTVEEYNTTHDPKLSIQYVEKRPELFDKELIEALAGGKGPDAILMPHDLIVRYEDKVYPITFATYPLRDFRDTFIEAAEVFVTPTGTLGIPFTVDPLVMYWNRDILATAEFVKPPETWSDLAAYVKKITKKDNARNISQSTIALGEYRNITNAKEILSALMLQAGTSITTQSDIGLVSDLGRGGIESAESPAVQALGFYTSFSNPASTQYSWNRALPSSKDVFANGDLALYLGMGNEVQSILEKNPNLNFDVAQAPQLKNAKTKITFGRVSGFSVMKLARDPFGTFQVLQILGGTDFLSLWSKRVNVAPSRRDLLSVRPEDPILDAIYSAAFVAKAWLDPNQTETDRIFQEMIERVTSGQTGVNGSLQTAHYEINSILTQ